jgi:hypothetical protein
LNTAIVFYQCPYLKTTFKGKREYCMLGRPEFGHCNTCPIYQKLSKEKTVAQ